MKWLISMLGFALGVLAVIVFLSWRTDTESGHTALKITWDGPYVLPVPESDLVPDANGNKALTIRPVLNGRTPFRATLFRITNPPLHHRFALQGNISYTNLPDNTALEMTAAYLIRTDRVNDDGFDLGPTGKILGSSSPRQFILTSSMLPGVGPLLEVDLDLYIGGQPVEDAAAKGQKPSITLSNLRFVSYPDPTPAEVAQMLGAIPTAERLFSWKWFSLGAACTAVLMLAMAQTVILIRRFRKLRADREMRQISSLDG